MIVNTNMKTIRHCYSPEYFYSCPKCARMYWKKVECDCDSPNKAKFNIKLNSDSLDYPNSQSD